MLKLFKLFLPPIFNRNLLRKYYQLLFEKKKTIHSFNYEKNCFKRQAFINKAISKFENCKYLEIGTNENKVFNTIPLKMKDKYGVDPAKGGNFRMTSDEFFEKYHNLKFDVIFIDGLHHYDQCQKDCLNAMKHLNKNGIIFFHDMLPRCELEQSVPQNYHRWSGDVWKVAVELNHSKNVNFKICNIDFGVGILKLNAEFEYKQMPQLTSMQFSDFLYYKNNFKIINSEQALDFIEEN